MNGNIIDELFTDDDDDNFFAFFM